MKKVLILMAMFSGASIFSGVEAIAVPQACYQTGLSVPACKPGQKPQVSCEYRMPPGEACKCTLQSCYTQ